jgi:predicted RNase H-like HicB family nuclease
MDFSRVFDGIATVISRRFVTRGCVSIGRSIEKYNMALMQIQFSIIIYLMNKISQKEIAKFQSLFPQEIKVAIQHSEDGGFLAEILSSPRVFTEAENFPELIEMVNDALYTYFEIPQEFVPFMPLFS